MAIKQITTKSMMEVFTAIGMKSIPFSAVALVLIQSGAVYGQDKRHDQLWQLYGLGGLKRL